MIALFAYIVIIIAAVSGFILAAYLGRKKKTHQSMVCPLHGDCEAVIQSEYSRFLGIPVEWLGMLYYVIIAFSYAVFLIWPALAIPSVVFIVLSLSTAAFLFSLYLTFIQIALLRELCTWCLTSAGICTIIFATALLGSEFSFLELLIQHRPIIVMLHLVGLALGLGGATFGDLFFFRFLKDLRISQYESEILKGISQVVWFGLALLIISGLALYLPYASDYNASSKFLAKVSIILVIITNGAFLNLMVAPRLIHITFGDMHAHQPGELRKARKLAFALGAISFVSWYSALILGALDSVPLSYSALMTIYFTLILVAILGSQLMERMLGKRPMPEIPEQGYRL